MTHTAFCAESALISVILNDTKHTAAECLSRLFRRLSTLRILKKKLVCVRWWHLFTMVCMRTDTQTAVRAESSAEYLRLYKTHSGRAFLYQLGTNQKKIVCIILLSGQTNLCVCHHP